jgi:hypothetical protein
MNTSTILVALFFGILFLTPLIVVVKNKLKKCPFCDMRIPEKAIKCPKCQSNLK